MRALMADELISKREIKNKPSRQRARLIMAFSFVAHVSI
jgi:hypothetical protein